MERNDICCYKLQAMRLAYPTGYLEKCRNCSGEYYVQCERYKPVSKTQEPIRQGVNALNLEKMSENVE